MIEHEVSGAASTSMYSEGGEVDGKGPRVGSALVAGQYDGWSSD